MREPKNKPAADNVEGGIADQSNDANVETLRDLSGRYHLDLFVQIFAMSKFGHADLDMLNKSEIDQLITAIRPIIAEIHRQGTSK